MSVTPSRRLRSHEDERAHSYKVLQAARDTAFTSRKYDSILIREQMAKEFRERTGGKLPYEWQLDVAEALHLGLDCTVIAGTGSGKTMPFVMPSFVNPDKIYIVLSPLNALETDQARRFEAMNISAVVLNRNTYSMQLLKEIEEFKYKILLTSPEMVQTKAVRERLSAPAFAKRVGAFIVDEAHCIKQWAKESTFRPEYGHLDTLRSLVPSNAPVLATSATLTPSALDDIRHELCIQSTRSFHLNLGNDRINIKQEMRTMSSASDYDALKFIVENAREARDLPRTIVFVDEVSKCHAITHRLRKMVGEGMQDYIGFFHARRTQPAKEKVWEGFSSGRIRVLIATEAAAMGMDIPDIELVVQFGVPENLCIWLQRAGRAGRSPSVQARAVMLVQLAVLQKVTPSSSSAEHFEDIDTDFHEEEELLDEPANKPEFKKNIEEALRAWIEAEGCRRAVADAYFDNPPRAIDGARPLSRCCDNCAKREQSSALGSLALSMESTTFTHTLDGASTGSHPNRLAEQDSGDVNGEGEGDDNGNDGNDDGDGDDGDDDNDDPGPDEDNDAEANEAQQKDPGRGEPAIAPQGRLSPKRRRGDHLKKVKQELRRWRVYARRKYFKGTSLKADVVLPDRTLQTIASLRRGIKTIDDLRPHLQKPCWPLLDDHGNEVLQLVQKLDAEDDEQRRLRNIAAKQARKRESERRKAEKEQASLEEAQRAAQWARSLGSYSGPLGQSSALNAPGTATDLQTAGGWFSRPAIQPLARTYQYPTQPVAPRTPNLSASPASASHVMPQWSASTYTSYAYRSPSATPYHSHFHPLTTPWPSHAHASTHASPMPSQNGWPMRQMFATQYPPITAAATATYRPAIQVPPPSVTSHNSYSMQMSTPSSDIRDGPYEDYADPSNYADDTGRDANYSDTSYGRANSNYVDVDTYYPDNPDNTSHANQPPPTLQPSYQTFSHRV